MAFRFYLPSAQFVLIVASLALSAGLVVAAERLSNKDEAPGALSSATAPTQSDEDWREALAQIELESGISLPEPPSEEDVAALLDAARDNNLTNSVSRTLLINLTSAASQGLGSDIPTQEKLVNEAVRELTDASKPKTYSSGELTLASNTNEDLRLYGNAVMAILLRHPGASVDNTFLAIGKAADSGNATLLSPLSAIQTEYEALTRELVATPVPQTLAPLHLQVVNAFARITASFADMKALIEDPLRGLVGLQTYKSLTDEAVRVFTTIGEQLEKNGILFNKDEPGALWSTFLSISP